MPNCFQLVRLSLLDEGPVALSKIDAEMCYRFDVEPDPVTYYRMWFDTIGFGLACGKSWDQLRKLFPTRVDIIDWLSDNFLPRVWVEHGE